MKPTFQNERPVRRGESVRPAGHSSSQSPVTDWNFQTSAADLRGGSTSSPAPTEESSTRQSLYGLSQTVFAAETRWEDRIEGIGLAVVIAIAACPIWEAIYIAARTV
jgi:hypothetical protein